ncbi:glycosyltransferase [Microbacterium sp.]|uniref:glycosyltransferase n=1 Tax=Microbacterium sp. TaxID=51671 RepID=UPI003C72168C
MTDADRVSVCMATYNGEKYIDAQLQSILQELDDSDEVVIVDDASTDGTLAAIAKFNDPRIRVISQTENRGYVRTFETAIRAATNSVLFLSDQDDEWVPGRRVALLEGLQNRRIVAGDLVLLGDDAPLTSPLTRRPWRLATLPEGGSIGNELRILAGNAPYYGCAMAIRRNALALILPFPQFLTESHDLWIATVGNVARTMGHVQHPVVRRRLHEANTSPQRPRGILMVVRSRVMLIRAWAEARRRVRLARR